SPGWNTSISKLPPPSVMQSRSVSMRRVASRCPRTSIRRSLTADGEGAPRLLLPPCSSAQAGHLAAPPARRSRPGRPTPPPEAPAGELLGERGAREVGDEGAAGDHGVASEAEGVGSVDRAAPVPRHAGGDRLERIVVEGVGMIDDPAARQRAEAGVEVVEALVHEPEGNHL